MPKAKIYPPPRPKREPHAVTIEVMRNEIETLLSRIDTLVKERDALLSEHDHLKGAATARLQEIMELREEAAEMEKANQRMTGWQEKST
jgi:predicted nuclease with TOPRIM domain